MAATKSHAVSGCPECGGHVRPDGIDDVCASCGLVVGGDAIDRGPDWGRRDEKMWQEDKHAKGVSEFLPDSGLGTEIGGHAGRLNTWHDRVKSGSTRQRNQRYATVEIRRMASALELPDPACDEGRTLAMQASDADAMQGRDCDAMAAAALFVACRRNATGRAASDIATVTKDVDTDTIINRAIVVCDAADVALPPPDIGQRVRVVASRLGLPQPIVEACVERADALDGATCSRGSPSTLAAALIWDEAPGVTQDTVSDAAGVSRRGLQDRHAQVMG